MEPNLGGYADEVRSWKHIDLEPIELERLCFYSNAEDNGDTPYQAAIGWQLVVNNGEAASLPRKYRRPPARVKHVGRITRRRQRRRLRAESHSATWRLARDFANTRINRERREDLALDNAATDE